MKNPLILSVLLALSGPTLAVAGSLADAATKAEQMAASGDATGARTLMRTALSDFSASLPFAIGKAVFVSAEPTGYEMYQPRETKPFAIGEQLVSYVEPVGLTWKPAAAGAGKMETHFTVDFDILDPKGQVLAGQKGFGDFTFAGFARNQEIFATLTLDLSGATAGDYVLRYHFNDLHGSRQASVDLPFTIAVKP
ncbi:hypothetical protein [Rhizobium sp. CC-YZS058]|uniref:hypothetical protein n=1 Tax=Rhizobium sp. CC-YZS058 TaxID=3042153 RepID=UPI002B055DA3|nr:hypothetical protein [Rhizobium sp. CC-YZS058]MEA3534900.1 hypothetical protein [Rhizobium sp. CC-YZS058]